MQTAQLQLITNRVLRVFPEGNERDFLHRSLEMPIQNCRPRVITHDTILELFKADSKAGFLTSSNENTFNFLME